MLNCNETFEEYYITIGEAPDTFRKKINELTPDLQKEVYDFVEFLELKRASKKKNKLILNWAGGLKEFRNQFISLELQKKTLDWFIE